MNHRIVFVPCLFLVWLAFQSSPSKAQEFRVLAWNIESNRPNSPPVSDIEVISEQLTELLRNPETTAQLIALSEVEPKHLQILQQAAAAGLGTEIDLMSSASGGFMDSDTLAFLVDKSRFEVDEVIELHRFGGIAANFNDFSEGAADFGAIRARSPLAVKLLDKSIGGKFWVIVNHLARGEADLRTSQARMLRKWAAAHPEPIIGAGDFNFDYDIRTGQGNEGFRAMFEDDTWEWIKPDPMIDTNWSTDRNITDREVDRYPDSILDFILVANQAKNWQGKSSVIVREGDFPDNDQTSDHRPVLGIFQPVR